MTIFEYSPEGAQHRQIRQSIQQNRKVLMREAPKGLIFTVMTDFLPKGSFVLELIDIDKVSPNQSGPEGPLATPQLNKIY